MLHRLIIIAVTLFSVFAGDRIAAQEVIGTVSRILGEANATRGGTARALSLNMSVILNETVSTGSGGRLEVTFKDNTRVTLGENAKLTLDRYAFNPAAGRRKIRFRIVGAFRFVAGKLSKLVRSDINVTTPAAAIGVERRRRAYSEPARPRHEYRRAGRSARARHTLAAGQGQPRDRDRDVPVEHIISS